MKKLLCVVLVIACVVGVLAFVSRDKKGEIGETYTDQNGIEFTVNTLEFANVIDGWGGANDNYWFPLTEESYKEHYSDVTRWDYKGYVKAHGLTPTDDNDMVLFISYTVKNTSEYDRTIDDIGVVTYDSDYNFSEGALTYRKSEGAVWQDLPNGVTFKKLDGNRYEFRAYVFVSKEAVESDKSLTYTLFGRQFDLRK